MKPQLPSSWRESTLLTAVLLFWILFIFYFYWATNGSPGLETLNNITQEIVAFFARFFTAPYYVPA